MPDSSRRPSSRPAPGLPRGHADYYAQAFRSSPVVTLLARVADGQIIDANEAFYRTTGYTPAEVVGRTTIELGLWPDPTRRQAVIAELSTRGCVRDFEADFLTKSGAVRYVLLNGDILELEGVTCMLITAVDISERRRREQVQNATYTIAQAALAGHDLAQLWAGLHRIVASLMSARNFYVALLSPDGSLLSFPYYVDETVPPPPPRKPGFGLTEYVIHTGRALLTTADQLTILLRDDARYVPVGKPAALWLGAPLIVEGRTIGVVAVQDYHNAHAYGEEEQRLLTFVASQAAAAAQRRQAEEALQRAERQYRGIFENALEGLYQTSAEGRFLRVNPALARMLGYASPAELMASINDIGRQFYADPGRRGEFMELIRGRDEVTDFESEVLRKDGTRLWVTESVRVVRNAAGEAVRFEGVAIDSTAQREAARALRAARDAADAASRAKSQFLASMSHELRTPLNGILGYTQLLGRDPALTGKQRDGIDIIHQSASHLLDLINDVLDLARIEARKLELHEAEFALPEFVHSIGELFAPRAREKDLRLETSFDPALPRLVRGDAQRLRQVLLNLLSNAIKFTRQGGVVFSVEPAGAALRFSVSDSGPGIAPEDQARLFEPFTQFGDVGQRTGGTGLGLNVSRNILEQMGSKLMLESRPGWGTRFWFELALPVVAAEPDSARPAPHRRLTGYTGPRRRVLVADDHGPNRTLLVDLLEPLGFTVETAADGRQAVEAARATRPDLVLMDLRMPQMDGLTATRAIRAAHPEQPPCVIAVSASVHEDQRQAALTAGCAAFLPKPLREEDLFGLVARHLGLTWLQDEAAPAAAGTAAPFAIAESPAPADAEALYDLASKGDVMGVRAYAQQLALREPRLEPFARQVIDLAARFKMKAIRSFVARHRALPDGTVPPA